MMHIEVFEFVDGGLQRSDVPRRLSRICAKRDECNLVNEMARWCYQTMRTIIVWSHRSAAAVTNREPINRATRATMPSQAGADPEKELYQNL
jgi:hypothetical protein